MARSCRALWIRTMIYVQGYSFGSKLGTPVARATIYRTRAVPCSSTGALSNPPPSASETTQGAPGLNLKDWTRHRSFRFEAVSRSPPKRSHARHCKEKKALGVNPREQPLSPPGGSQGEPTSLSSWVRFQRAVSRRRSGMRDAWSAGGSGLKGIYEASQLSRRAATWLDRSREWQSRPQLFQVSGLFKRLEASITHNSQEQIMNPANLPFSTSSASSSET